MFCQEHPKRDENPKFTSLSETTRIPIPFIYGVPPLPPGRDGERSKGASAWKSTLKNDIVPNAPNSDCLENHYQMPCHKIPL